MANINDVHQSIGDLRTHLDERFDKQAKRVDDKTDALHERISDLRDDLKEEHDEDSKRLQDHEMECAKWKAQIQAHVRIVQWVCGTIITALALAWAQQFFN